MAFRKAVAFLACFFVSTSLSWSAATVYYIDASRFSLSPSLSIENAIAAANTSALTFSDVTFAIRTQNLTQDILLGANPDVIVNAITKLWLAIDYSSNMKDITLNGDSKSLFKKSNDLDIVIWGNVDASGAAKILTLRNFSSTSTAGSVLSVGGALQLSLSSVRSLSKTNLPVMVVPSSLRAI